jgi:hypothetical protein
VPEHELACGSEPAWEHVEGEAIAELQPPQASGCEATTSSRGRRLRVVEAPLPEKHQALLPDVPNVEVFSLLSPVLLQEQPVVVLLLERGLVSFSLAIDEHGGHEDLRGSGRWSVIPYVYGRTELYWSRLPFLSLPICPPPVKRCLFKPFIAQGRTVILRSGAQQVASWWLKPYTTSRVLITRSSK